MTTADKASMHTPAKDGALALPSRTQKPRATGLTSIHEVGLPIGELKGILADFHDYIDIAKLGIGSAYVTPNLHEKVQAYQDHNIHVYFGGTLFEKFYSQGKLDQYADFLREYGVDWIEVSNGTMAIDVKERIRVIENLKSEFTVVAEVGCKDAGRVMPPSEWVDEMQTLLAAGARYVITEGRDSGTAGLYRSSGELRTGLVADIVRSIDPALIIFESPAPKKQMHFINEFGPNVNLGNVRPREVLALEAQRVGLRSETFWLSP